MSADKTHRFDKGPLRVVIVPGTASATLRLHGRHSMIVTWVHGRYGAGWSRQLSVFSRRGTCHTRTLRLAVRNHGVLCLVHHR